MSFDGKTALITGGTSGIGLAAARQFAAAGAQVIVAGRDGERGAAAVTEIDQAGSTGARFIPADLSAEGAARTLAHAAGDVDILINNAGVFPFGPTHEVLDAVVREVFAVNVVAPFALTAELAPAMAERGHGVIVNVSTMVASFGLPGMSAYGASKAALEALTRFWAAEYGPAVRVNTVAPGPTRTPGTEPMGDEIDVLASTLPLARAASAEEIAQVIVFLASDAASFVTGATVAADGGRTAV